MQNLVQETLDEKKDVYTVGVELWTGVVSEWPAHVFSGDMNLTLYVFNDSSVTCRTLKATSAWRWSGW